MIDNYVGVMRKYAAFSGRATRSEYWLFALAQVVILVGFGVVAFLSLFSGSEVVTGALLAIAALYMVGTILPGLGVTVRRFHDAGYSGWMVLLGLIPTIGGIVVLVFMVLPSERGDNRHGADPRGGTGRTSSPPYVGPGRPGAQGGTHRIASGDARVGAWAGYAGWDGYRPGNGDTTFL